MAELGDPRFKSDFLFLPNEDLLGFVKIPSGSFIMGGKKETYSLPIVPETPQRKICLPDYYIGRYDVTDAQYKFFIEDSGYKMDFDEGLRRGVSNHPMKWITWFEAMAYCTWLNKKLLENHQTPPQIINLLNNSWIITLPDEAEWEKAARGTDGHIYPWGNQFSYNKANIDGSGITELASSVQDGTSPVGAFPQSASPYKIYDLSGNVWNWTRSIAHEKKPSRLSRYQRFN